MDDEHNLIQLSDGSKFWYLNDKLHRIGEPAVEWPSGYKEWWQYGLLHRLDGPAIEREDGVTEWFLDGVEYSEDEHYFQVMMRFST